MEPISAAINPPPQVSFFRSPGASGSLLFQLTGVYFDLSSAWKKVRKSLKENNWKFIDHGSKGVDLVGSALVRVGFLLDSIKTFLPAGKSFTQVAKVAIPVFVGIGVAFSTTSLFNDGRNIYKIWQFQKKFTVIHNQWNTEVGREGFRTREAAFVALHELIETSQPGIVRKALGVNKVALQGRLAYTHPSNHNDQEVTALFRHLDKRISAQLTHEGRKVAMDVTSLVSSIFLIIPVLQPAGFVLFGISLGVMFYNYKYNVRDAYNFERKIGIINATPGEHKTFRKYCFDKYGITSLIRWIKPEKKASPPAPPVLRPSLAINASRYRYRYS